MEGMRVFSSSWDFCCLKTMTTSLIGACEPSQEKLKAAVTISHSPLSPDVTVRSQYPVLQRKVGGWLLFHNTS